MSITRLVLRRPDGTEQEYPLQRGANRVGRHPGCEVRLTDALVSKRHAVIEVLNGDWVVRDLRSTNGVKVNGRKVKVSRIRDGDSIAFGRVQTKFLRPIADSFEEESSLKVLPSKQDNVVHSLPPSPLRFAPAEDADPADLPEEYEKLRVVHEFCAELPKVVTLEGLLEHLLTYALRLLPGNAALVAEVTMDGYQEASSRGAVAVSRAVLDQVRETQQSLLVNDAQKDERLSDSNSVQMYGLRSLLAVPLVVRGKIEWIMLVENNGNAFAFTERDLKLLQGIAAQASRNAEHIRLLKQGEEKAQQQFELSRFLSPTVAAAVDRGELALRDDGEARKVAVLAANVRIPTGGPVGREQLALINMYAELLFESVFQFDGMLVSYSGDELCAIWGVPASGHHITQAMRCSQEVQARLESLNALRGVAGEPTLRVSIGLGHGEALVGRLGAGARVEFAAVGPPVTLARTLAHAAKPDETLGPTSMFESLVEKVVLGRTRQVPIRDVPEPVSVVTVMGFNDNDAEDTFNTGNERR